MRLASSPAQHVGLSLCVAEPRFSCLLGLAMGDAIKVREGSQWQRTSGGNIYAEEGERVLHL